MNLWKNLKRGWWVTLILLIAAFFITFATIFLWELWKPIPILLFFFVAYFVGHDPWDDIPYDWEDDDVR